MKRVPFALIILVFAIAGVSACSWKPAVTAVPITAPWNSLNLPLGDGAVVWRSDSQEFRAVHRDSKQAVTKSYTEALKSGGWQVEKFHQSGERYILDMTKGDEALNLEFYDFDNTGVMIKKL